MAWIWEKLTICNCRRVINRESRIKKLEIFSFDLSKKLTKVFKGKINREIEKCCNESKENIVVSGKESCGIIVDVNSVSILKEDTTEIRRNIPIRRDYETI